MTKTRILLVIDRSIDVLAIASCGAHGVFAVNNIVSTSAVQVRSGRVVASLQQATQRHGRRTESVRNADEIELTDRSEKLKPKKKVY